jgi:hypothetical protein
VAGIDPIAVAVRIEARKWRPSAECPQFIRKTNLVFGAPS